jgi:DNA/RNA endonuclease G (NUC1)
LVLAAGFLTIGVGFAVLLSKSVTSWESSRAKTQIASSSHTEELAPITVDLNPVAILPDEPVYQITAARPPQEDPFLKYTPTEDYFVRPFGLTAYNGMTRCPLWVLERLTKKHLAGKAKRIGLDFFADQEIPIEFRAHPQSYAGQGEDKGHAASAANHEHDMEEMKSTFTMINCMPQTPECNRLIVLQGEDMAREFAEIDDNTIVYRTTAPCWLPEMVSRKDGLVKSHYEFKAIGADRIWVPTHIAFSLYIVKIGGSVTMRGWLVPNLEKYPEKATFDTYKKDVDFLEMSTGLNFWKGLDQPLQDHLEKETH